MINDAGLELLEDFESFVGHAYPDPYSPLGKALQRGGLWKSYLKKPMLLSSEMQALSGAPWTIGLGFTKGVKAGDKMTKGQAKRRLAEEMDAEYVQPLLKACKIEPNENQLAGMACLAWNIGISGTLKSTVLKCHNRGDTNAAARAFALWNKAAGEVSAGLTRRRAAEAALYLTPVDDEEPEPMPQQVDPEKSMAKSGIITGTTVSTVAGTTALVAESVRSVKDVRESIGDFLPWVLIAAAIGGAVYVIWNRLNQRDGGLA